MSKFLVKLLKTELDNIPKRVIYFNLEKQRTIEEQKDFHEKTFGSISSYLREEVKLTLKDLQSSKSIDSKARSIFSSYFRY